MFPPLCVCSVAPPCPTPCSCMDCSPPGSSVHGILQARILQQAVISYSRGSSQLRHQTHISCIFCVGRQTLYHQHHLGSPIPSSSVHNNNSLSLQAWFLEKWKLPYNAWKSASLYSTESLVSLQRISSWSLPCVCAYLLSRVRLFVTPWTVAHQPPLSMGILQPRILEFSCPPQGDLPNPGVEPRSPALQVNSLSSEPPGKPKNTWMGSLSLLQGNFPTQESNRDLLHGRWILYQLSYTGSPVAALAYPFFLVLKHKVS